MPIHMLSPAELERRLLGWLSTQVMRYPFFEASLAPRAAGAPGPSLNAPASPSFSSPYSPFASSPTSSPSTSRYASASSSLQDLNQWYNYVETASSDCRVPVEQYPDVALYLLRGDLKDVMHERKEEYMKQTKKSFWDWSDFKDDLRRIVEEAAKIISSPQMTNMAQDAIGQLRFSHPYIASSLSLGLMVGGTVILLPALGMMAWNKIKASQPQGMAPVRG